MPRFEPGKSGNPGGKPKLPNDVKMLARLYTAEAVEALRKALKAPGERVPAANTLLAYGYGKPTANLTVRVITNLEELSDDELRAIAGDDETPMIEGKADPAE